MLQEMSGLPRDDTERSRVGPGGHLQLPHPYIIWLIPGKRPPQKRPELKDSRAGQGHRGHPFVPRTAWGIVEAWGSLTSPSPQRQERLPGGGHTGCQAEAGTGQCPRASKKPNPRTVSTDTPTSPHGTWAPVGTLNVLGPFHRCPGNVFAQDWVFWWAFRGEMSPGKIYARKDSVWMPSAPCPHVLSPPV